MRQRVLSFLFQLRLLFASLPALMGQVLSIVYRTIATYVIKKAGLPRGLPKGCSNVNPAGGTRFAGCQAGGHWYRESELDSIGLGAFRVKSW